MITNFKEVTADLSPDEMKIIPKLIWGFKQHDKAHPIKAPEIVKRMNAVIFDKGRGVKMTEVRLRKMCGYIRVNGLLPLIATSEGYYVSYDRKDIEAQIQSLQERAASILAGAEGLKEFLQPEPSSPLREPQRPASGTGEAPMIPGSVTTLNTKVPGPDFFAQQNM